MPIRNRPHIAAAVIATAGLLLVGCGSDGPDAYSAPQAAESTETAPPPEATDSVEAAEPSTSDPATASAGSVEPNGEVVDVRALDNTFIDEEIEIAAGTEVRWENRGRNDHDVVPVDDTQDWGVGIEGFTPGDEYAHVFTTPGTYRYYCTVHGTADVGMVGVVVVT